MQNLFEKLTQRIEKLEGVKSNKRGQTIRFSRKNPFASLSLKRNKIEFKFTTPSKINHTRLKKIKKIKSDKFSHTTVIAKEEQVDAQVTGWIMIAHATN